MAKLITNPNPYSQILSDRFKRRILIIVSLLGGMALAYAISQNTNVFASVLAYVVAVVCAIASYKIFKQMGKNDRGESGESDIKKLLLELPDTYTVFQNVLIKSNLDIDFVVVGPKNIFAIEVKSHAAISFFGGKKFINQTFAEAMLLKEYLQASGVNAFVLPVLVYSRAPVKNRAPLNAVCVTSADWLLAYIAQARTSVFDKAKTEAIIHRLYSK